MICGLLTYKVTQICNLFLNFLYFPGRARHSFLESLLGFPAPLQVVACPTTRWHVPGSGVLPHHAVHSTSWHAIPRSSMPYPHHLVAWPTALWLIDLIIYIEDDIVYHLALGTELRVILIIKYSDRHPHYQLHSYAVTHCYNKVLYFWFEQHII